MRRRSEKYNARHVTLSTFFFLFFREKLVEIMILKMYFCLLKAFFKSVYVVLGHVHYSEHVIV